MLPRSDYRSLLFSLYWYIFIISIKFYEFLKCCVCLQSSSLRCHQLQNIILKIVLKQCQNMCSVACDARVIYYPSSEYTSDECGRVRAWLCMCLLLHSINLAQVEKLPRQSKNGCVQNQHRYTVMRCAFKWLRLYMIQFYIDAIDTSGCQWVTCNH